MLDFFERKEKMKKKDGVKFTFLALIISIVFGGVYTYAEESQTSNGANESDASGFTYQVIHPDNQNKESGFFDLKMTPGQKQTVEIKLKNHSKEDLTVNVKINGAKTNPNGVIEYGPNKLSDDKSMKFKFTDLVKGPESVTLKPETEESLKLEIAMPETEFDGIILGGIQLQRKEEAKKNDENKGTMVINKYAYVIGMRLKETDKELPLDIHFVKAYGATPDFRNTIVIDLGNKQATIMEELNVEAQILGEKSDEVLYESKKIKMRMAPNSLLNFPVSMDGQAMKAGNYRAHVLATSGDKRWEWNGTFSITKEEAEKFNNEAVGLDQERGIDWKLIGLIIGGIVTLVIVVFLFIRLFLKKNNQKKKLKNKAKNKQQKRKKHSTPK